MRVKSSLFLSLLILLLLVFSCTQEVSSGPSFIFKPAPSKEAVMKINNKLILENELIAGIENDLYEAEVKVYELKFNKLRAMALEKLMESDPNKKGLTNDQFMDKYISKGRSPSKQDIEKFIKERKIPKEHINAQLKERVSKYLEIELKKGFVEDWIKEKTANNPIEVYLTKPNRPVFDVEVGDSPVYGKADSKVTVVEFSDFQCPFCAKGSKIITDLKEKYGPKIKVVFKNFPLPFHKQAKGAAVAGLCANEQGADYFWKMHDAMFEDQAALGTAELKKTAQKLGLDNKIFDKCLDSNKYLAQVDKDMVQGQKIGVKSTPTFFVNGKVISGAQPLEVFSELIDEGLAK